jgi:hypothetical protein
VAPDRGLPVPNSEKLYIGGDGVVHSGDESLEVSQHSMPGIGSPYLTNSPQPVQERYFNKPVFLDFPFGYVASNLNLYEAAGKPVACNLCHSLGDSFKN